MNIESMWWEELSAQYSPKDAESVEGLFYVQDYISPETEARLLAKLGIAPKEGIEPTEAKKWVGVTASAKSRQVIHYGFKYDYAHSGWLTETEPIPTEFIDVLKSSRAAGMNQLIINKYEPGQGISPHVDNEEQFGEIISCITLGSGCDMIFTHLNDHRVVRVHVQPRSMYLMMGKARHSWAHAIEPKKYDMVGGKQVDRGTRISLTFRKANPARVAKKDDAPVTTK